LQFSKKRRQNEEQEKEFEQWRKQIRKEMIKIKQEEKKLPPSQTRLARQLNSNINKVSWTTFKSREMAWIKG